MGRISEQEVGRLKREVSVQRLAEARGVKLKKHGKDLMGLCPFHDDREPSLVITPAKNIWHCLGACQAGGSVIDWVMREQGASFRLAVELLRRDHPSLAAGSEPRSSLSPKLDAIAEPDEPDDVVLLRVVDYYHATLKGSPEALGYLQQRGLVHGEVVEHFKLGYANRTLGYRLPGKALKRGQALRSQLQRLGVMRDSGHEHLSGSLVVPIFDAHGRVTELYGRKILDRLRAGTPKHLYLPGPHRGIFNRQALMSSDEVIVCESLLDALTFWCAGYRHVTSAYGTEGFTRELHEAMREHEVKRVLLAYDADEAGNKAAEQLAPRLAADGIEVLRVQFPKGMDANEYARAVKPANKSLGTALRAASWMAGPKRDRSAKAAPAVQAAVPAPSLAACPPPASSEASAVLVEAEPASTSPAAGSADVSDSEVVLHFGDRRWRIRGLDKNQSPAQLRVNVLVGRGADFHVDQLELYSARHRAAFVRAAAEELQLEERILKRDLGQVLLKLEALQEDQLQKQMQPRSQAPTMTEAQRKEALALLKDPKLLSRILTDYAACGVVGEEDNKLLGYLAAVSRKLDEPLAVVLQSSSAAGKSSLMDAILRFVPEEERVSYSAMTGQSLFYMGETDLSHKILAIAEEEGAQSASYALKLLQSEGELTIASTGKDPATGRLVTHEYRVQGPVQLFLTTTAIEVDEELLNRCVVLTVDEGRAQTQAIHAMQRQRKTLPGVLAKQDVGRVLQLHQNAQRLLRPLFVVNPFADRLRFPDHVTRTRRDHKKYLALIESVALLHQYQRPVKEVEHRGAKLRYIEVSKGDLEVADRLLPTVLGHTLSELPPQTKKLLSLVQQLVAERAKAEGVDGSDVRFTRRQVREHTGWGHTQLKVHLGRLLELELLLVHRGRHSQQHLYELASFGVATDRSATGRPPVGAAGRPVLSSDPGDKAQPVGASAQPRGTGSVNGASYPQTTMPAPSRSASASAAS